MSNDEDSKDPMTPSETFQALVAIGGIITAQNALFLSITEVLASGGAFNDEEVRKEYFGAVRKMLGETATFNAKLLKGTERLTEKGDEAGGGGADGQ